MHPTPKKTKMKKEEENKTMKVLSYKLTRLRLKNNAYVRRPKDTDYAHTANQASIIDTQATII